MIPLPRLYAILDASCFPDTEALCRCASELVAGGVTLLQYRNKSGNAAQMLEHARELKRRLGASVKLIMNDRADLCLAAEFDGVHVGQDDLSPEGVQKSHRRSALAGSLYPQSRHSLPKPTRRARTISPSARCSRLGSKANPDPVIGLEGVRQARGLTRKPLVAIGGITRANCSEVIAAGADAVAVISDLLREPRKSAEEFFRILG